MTKLTKEEIKANRENAKKLGDGSIIKGSIKYIINILKEDWKTDKKGMITSFLWGVFIMYLIGTAFQVGIYDVMWCDSSINKFDGKPLLVYNDFVKELNKKTLEQTNRNTEKYIIDKKQTFPEFNSNRIGNVNLTKEYKINCTMNPNWFKNVKADPKSEISDLIKEAIKVFFKIK